MRPNDIANLRQEGENPAQQRRYARHALAIIGQIHTDDQALAGHLLDAEQALRKAQAMLDEKLK